MVGFKRRYCFFLTISTSASPKVAHSSSQMTLIIITLIAILHYLGGRHNGKMFRRIAIPALLALYCACALKTWWLFFAVGAGLQSLGIGYGNYSPEDDDKPSFLGNITRDRQGCWVRAIWGLLVASMTSLGLLLGGFISLWVYLGYIVLNSITGFLISKLQLPVLLCDLLVGASLASIVLFI